MFDASATAILTLASNTTDDENHDNQEDDQQKNAQPDEYRFVLRHGSNQAETAESGNLEMQHFQKITNCQQNS